MQAIKAIMENLRAMGANPETVQNADGEKMIKVNAPILNGETGNNEKTENKKI